MKKRVLICLMSSVILSFFIVNAQATSHNCRCLGTKPAPRGAWYAELGVGGGDYKTEEGSVPQLSFPPDLYLTSAHKSDVFLTAGGGYSWFQNKPWFPILSLGLEYSYFFPFNVNGQIEQFSLPQFTNYDYGYKLRTQQINLIGKAHLYRWEQFLPFVLAGIGNAWNTVSNYGETALPGITPRVSPGFTRATQTNFVYILGIGLDYAFNKNFLLGLSYRYDNFGRAHSGNGESTFSQVDLSLQNRSYVNSLLLNLRYNFL